MKQKKLVVHVVLNSHLDPVWRWGRGAGIDEAIATARTACDVLDDFPETHVTRGESWVYETVCELDPKTFKRMQKHVAAGRLHIVGGWYVQPDCNLPSPETFRMHARVAGEFFRKHFGIRQVATGYNVDSFGHGAYLPQFYSEAGFQNYIMMRPGPHEKTLPREVFQWRSPNNFQILTARIPVAYNCGIYNIEQRLNGILELADRNLGHTLFFCGLGDHGAGPTRLEIEYLLQHWNDYPDVEFRFSHPDAFFDAVRATRVKFPVVTGELQHHAIGCYSAIARIKRELRLTEDRLLQAQHLVPEAERNDLWKPVLFATFHDVLAGSSVESAYPELYDELAGVRAHLQTLVNKAVRIPRQSLGPDKKKRQFLFLDNFSDKPFRGLAEIEPWVNYGCNVQDGTIDFVRITTSAGKEIPYQRIIHEAASYPRPRLAIPVAIPAHGRLPLFLDYNHIPVKQTSEFPVDADELASFRLGRRNFLGAPIRFDVLSDETDTWSHGVNGYPTKVRRTLKPVGPFQLYQTGPFLEEAIARYTDTHGNTIDIVRRRESTLPGIRLRLRVRWNGAREILKMIIQPSFQPTRRIDGVSGGPLERKFDGEEYPIFNYIWLQSKSASLATVSKDIFSADVQPDGTIRLTLLRTPIYCHHDPFVPPTVQHYPVTNQGESTFDIAFLLNPTQQQLDDEITRQANPLVFSESTLGVHRFPEWTEEQKKLAESVKSKK
ncbi:MAG: hypothetical protein IJJ26_04955 [Victivallales bacterium]|nr:hypothetical protein [Victivallales bacterium]